MTERAAFRPTLAVDFDGVINPYSRGWQRGELYERTVTPGFWDWLNRVVDSGFDVVIHSSRFGDEAAALAVRTWLDSRWVDDGSPGKHPFAGLLVKLSATKPPAWLTIDDRCVLFTGNWNAPELQPEAMLAFKPWTQRKAEG